MAISNNPKSPRQRMINLMYLVFIALLALNTPIEVLDGFDLVEEGLEQTVQSSQKQNNIIIRDFEEINNQNPIKASEWYNKANDFTKRSDNLFNYIQDLKVKIVKQADGKDGDVNNIKKRDDLGASSVIMLGPINPEGENLRNAIDEYRKLAIELLSSDRKKENINQILNTNVPKKSRWDNKSWEESYFEDMPTSAAVTLLTKIQSDIRSSQGEVLSDLLDNVGAGDYRVNKLEAQVIPKSEYVMAGSAYEGKIVLSAVDTTKKPKFSIPSVKENGDFSIGAGAVGINKIFSGNLILSTPDGDRKYPFKSEYNVVPKTTTIQVVDANILYQGEPNKLTISVPGLSNDQLRATATNGSITKSGENWIATPSKAGSNMKITVFNTKTNSLVSEQEFRVRILPDPTPYFEFPDANGNLKRFKSGNRITKNSVLAVPQIKAAIDDGLLDRQFDVLRFSVVIYDGIGNRISEISTNGQITEKQRALIRQLGRGKTFLISDVKARGRDGVERDIASLEVKLN